ncbi:MAG: universal stress protein [Amphritea sp.]|nr:universal stress protein [Amphritea sp.]
MFRNIVVPVDLKHLEVLNKAIIVAADMARNYDATVTMVAVAAAAPSEVAHNPAELNDVLEAFAASKSDELGIQFKSWAAITPDPAVDLEKVLNKVTHELKADLVVMASHVPTFRDHFMSSHTGYLATHTDVSVFIVR